jgi:zinc protease
MISFTAASLNCGVYVLRIRAIGVPTLAQRIHHFPAVHHSWGSPEGVTREEVDAAKKAILAKRRTFTDEQIVVQLAFALFNSDSLEGYAERNRKLGEVTVDQVNAALRKHLQPKNLVIVEAGDFRKTEK